MERENLVGMVEQRCPYAQRSQMRMLTVEKEEGRVVMALEDSQENLNAFGLVHAGAICGLTETATGSALLSYLDPSEYIILNTVLNIRFIAMPRGELTCAARVTADEFAAVMEEVLASGKADKTVDTKVKDSAGRVVAEAHATFRVMPTPAEFKSYFS
jgi:uncharacterized protein (TIGR00369 family)